MIEEKSNVSRVQKLFGSYRFEIQGYSGLSTRIGDSVESPEFTLCGHTWQLRIFPGGSLESHKGYISYYLASKSSKVARASYKLSVENQILGGEDESFVSSGIRIFEAKGVQVDGWGRDKFMLASTLRDPELGFSVDDKVIFKVEITAYGDLETTPTSGEFSKSLLKSFNLRSSLESILYDEKSSDVKLIVGANEEVIHAHKLILMIRSEVFQAMFSSSMCESIKNEVRIPDFEPHIIKEMLKFIYTDVTPEKSFLVENCTQLLCASLKYQIDGLTLACELFFSNNIQVETALSMLKFSDMIGAFMLKQKILYFIAVNSSRIVKSKEFVEVDSNLLKEMNSIIETINNKKKNNKVANSNIVNNNEKKSNISSCIMS